MIYGDELISLGYFYGKDVVNAIASSGDLDLIDKMNDLQLDQYGGKKFARARRCEICRSD